jgi:transcriptional antiterminator RfaH
LSGLHRRWYPVQTQAGREAFAAGQLENQGYSTFFPRRLVTVRHARRLHRRQASYFPSYIFVALDLANDRWRPINGTFGVRSLVMFGGGPLAVPDGLIDSLRACAGADGVLDAGERFAPGDRVRMLSGPFADVLGVIDRLEGEDRVRILMDLVCGGAPVVTKSCDIALAS